MGTHTTKKAATKETTTKKLAASKLVVATSRRPAHATKPKVSAARLEELVEEATVDAYDEDEQRVGFLTMLQDNLEVPFETEMLGVQVQIVGVDFNDADEIVAICKRGAHVQRIPVVDLPLPEPPPEGFEWIEAYRFTSAATADRSAAAEPPRASPQQHRRARRVSSLSCAPIQQRHHVRLALSLRDLARRPRAARRSHRR